MKLEIADFPVVGGSYSAQNRLGFRPRRDLDPVQLEVPLDWAVDPFKDRNWRFQLNAWRMLPAIWSEFLKGKDGHLLDEILSWIRDWHRYHFRERRESGMTWHDMATGIRAQHLALVGFLSKRGDIVLSPADADMVESLVVEHAQQLLNEEFIARGNHAIFQLVGLRLLGEVFPEITASEHEVSYSTRLMGKLIRSQFGPLGVHVENSPSYHHFAIQQFGRINPALFPSLEAKLRATLSAAREVEPWFSLPDGYIAGFGDSEGMSKAVLGASARANIETQSAGGHRILAKDLSAAGYSVVRTAPEVPIDSASMLIVKSQCLSSGHAQADHSTFELFERGARLLVDSGKFTYDTNHWRRYFKSDRAHNVVGLVHREFDPGATPPGSAEMSPLELRSDGVFHFHTRVSRSKDFKHERVFEYSPGRRLRLRDKVLNEANGRAVAFFHLPPELTASIQEGTAVNVVDMAGALRMRFTFDRFKLVPRIVHGQTEPYLQGWYSPSYRVMQPSTVIELVAAAGVDQWTVDINIAEGDSNYIKPVAPWPIELPRELSEIIRIRTVKAFVNDQGRREFRMLFEQPEPSTSKVLDDMIKAIAASGYAATSSGRRKQGLGATFEHVATGGGLRLLIRGRDTYPVKFPGMEGTTYLALIDGDR